MARAAACSATGTSSLQFVLQLAKGDSAIGDPLERPVLTKTRLHISSRQESGIGVLAPEGEIDAMTRSILAAALSEALAAPGTRLILDLSGVTFLDSGGLGTISDQHRAARENGGMLSVYGGDPRRTRVLWLTGMADWLPVHPDLTTALAATQER
nr:STAS domain-containing protein [Herbidospora cretacea]